MIKRTGKLYLQRQIPTQARSTSSHHYLKTLIRSKEHLMPRNTNKKHSKLQFARTLLVVLLSFCFVGCKNVDLKQISDTISQMQQPLDEQTVVAGLKQALEIGTNNTTNKTSRKDGFNGNPLIHISLPKELLKVASTLDKVGLGHYADEFELQMNRAAEKASREAKTVFIDSISRMSLKDAWGILNGADNAATQYFRQDTEQQLTKKFKPIIKSSMNKVGLYSDYQQLLSAYNKIPFTKKPDLDLENYVMQKSLDGLFLLVAKEESKIRKEPAARVTELLQRVFR